MSPKLLNRYWLRCKFSQKSCFRINCKDTGGARGCLACGLNSLRKERPHKMVCIRARASAVPVASAPEKTKHLPCRSHRRRLGVCPIVEALLHHFKGSLHLAAGRPGRDDGIQLPGYVFRGEVPL